MMQSSSQIPGFLRSNRQPLPAISCAMSGVTGIELMVVLAIIGILAAMAVPAFSGTLERQRLINPAQALLADLRWARGEAIKRNTKVRVTFTTGSNWQYTINTYPALTASDGSLPKTVSSSVFPGVTLTSASFFGNVAYTQFEAARGTSLYKNGGVTFTVNQQTARVSVSILGRARICDAPGGYPACS